MNNYRFTKGNEANKIVLKAHRAVVTAANLTDDLAQVILGIPGFSHNVELIPGREEFVEKKSVTKTDEVELPESIRLALKEAKIDETALATKLTEPELSSVTSTPSTAKKAPKKRGKR